MYTNQGGSQTLPLSDITEECLFLPHKEAAATAREWWFDQIVIKRNKQKPIFISGWWRTPLTSDRELDDLKTLLLLWICFVLQLQAHHFTPLILCSSPTYLSVLFTEMVDFFKAMTASLYLHLKLVQFKVNKFLILTGMSCCCHSTQWQQSFFEEARRFAMNKEDTFLFR